jgi:hypothetical protein
LNDGMGGELRGVALLPDEGSSRRLIALSAQLADLWGGPPLDPDAALPHVTLYQSLLPPGCSGPAVGGLLGRLAALCDAARPLVLSRVVVRAGVWVFALVDAPWLGAAEAEARRALAPHSTAIGVRPPGMELHTAAERESQVRHGYRYAAEAFLPHVTLGVLAEPITGHTRRARLVDARLDRMAAHLFPAHARTVEVSQVVAYDAGPNGVCAEVTATTAVVSRTA